MRNVIIGGVKKVAIEFICLIYFRWYHVNYKMAEPLRYGFKEGCDFVKKSCKDYMQMKKAVLVFQFQFVLTFIHVMTWGNQVYQVKVKLNYYLKPCHQKFYP